MKVKTLTILEIFVSLTIVMLHIPPSKLAAFLVAHVVDDVPFLILAVWFALAIYLIIKFLRWLGVMINDILRPPRN